MYAHWQISRQLKTPPVNWIKAQSQSSLPDMPTQVIQRAAEICSLSWVEVVSLWKTCHADKLHNLPLKAKVNYEGKITTPRGGIIHVPTRQLLMPLMEAHSVYLKRLVLSRISEILRLPMPIGCRGRMHSITPIMATIHTKANYQIKCRDKTHITPMMATMEHGVRYPTEEKTEGRPIHFQNC
jgi:hypothetical protein